MFLSGKFIEAVALKPFACFFRGKAVLHVASVLSAYFFRGKPVNIIFHGQIKNLMEVADIPKAVPNSPSRW